MRIPPGVTHNALGFELEIRKPIIAMNNGFHRVGRSGRTLVIAVVGRSPIGDKNKKECEHQQDKDDAENPFQYSFHKTDDV